MGPGSAAHHCVLRCVRGAGSVAYPFTSCFSDAVAGLPLAPAGTRTGSPSARPSGGAVMTRSSGRKTGGDFDFLAEVAGDRHRLEQHLVVGTDGRDPKAALVENERAGRNMQRQLRRAAAAGGRWHSRPASARRRHCRAPSCMRVVPEDDVDRLRGGLHRRRERAVRIFRHRQHGLRADPDRGHVVLRHVDIDAQLGDVGDHEHRRARHRRRH